jgi:metal-responsive CopG/Arc/MetJ family transcriptional regulator
MALKDENVQISVTLPRKFVEDYLDKDAEKELRTRSKQVAKIIMDYYNLNK